MAAIAPAPEANFDIKLIAPFLVSVQSVFKTMLSMDVTLGKPYLKSVPVAAYHVSGIIGFSGDIVGSMTVSFNRDTATKVVATFACGELPIGSPDFADAIGELANMIAGTAKKSFEANARITVPTVIIGERHNIARLKDVACVVVPCKIAAGDFTVEVSIRRSSPKA